MLLLAATGVIVHRAGGFGPSEPSDSGNASPAAAGEAAEPSDVGGTGEQASEAADQDSQTAGQDSLAPGTDLSVQDVAQVVQEFGSTTSWRTDEPLQQTGRALLEGYQEQGSCVLVRAGYLDLLGQVWECTVLGDGWVDVCVVGEEEDGCLVWRTRMEVSEVERLCEEEGWLYG